jgi:hypothetical protein
MTKAKASEILRGGVAEQVVPPELDPEVPHFVFKSKYKEDKVTLKKGRKESLPDGSSRVEAPVLAEFTRYTWSTDDPASAEILRGFIADRLRAGNPLHILETTQIKE